VAFVLRFLGYLDLASEGMAKFRGGILDEAPRVEQTEGLLVALGLAFDEYTHRLAIPRSASSPVVKGLLLVPCHDAQ